MEVVGAKGAFFVGDRMPTLLRDDITGIDWPNHWDLPGGGRDGAESPQHCWALLPPRLYLALPRLVPRLAANVRLWLTSPEAEAPGG